MKRKYIHVWQIPMPCSEMLMIVVVSVLLGKAVGLYWLVPLMILLIWDASINVWDLLLRLRDPQIGSCNLLGET